MVIVALETTRITDWATFHDVFAEQFGFPDFYGRNMNAWIDCMGYLSSPQAGMSTIHTMGDGPVVLQLEDVDDFATRCPEQYAAIIECSAFVNWRLVRDGHQPVLAISFYKCA
jgi:hypothetical protein